MNSAVIVAAGKGTRMGINVNKLFLELKSRPVIAHSWKAFDRNPNIDQIVLVVREDNKKEFQKVAEEYEFQKPYRFAFGGNERQDSVWNGIQKINHSEGLVAIHDGARPCVTQKVINDNLKSADKFGAAVSATLLTDTIKQTNDGQFISEHLDRSKLRCVQTPQCFKVPVIKDALISAIESKRVFTDDTAACQAIGQRVELVISEDPNIKITTPNDIPLAELFVSEW